MKVADRESEAEGVEVRDVVTVVEDDGVVEWDVESVELVDNDDDGDAEELLETSCVELNVVDDE